jgi:hypothetical protein
MHSKFRGRLAIVASLALLAACDSTPTQPTVSPNVLTAAASVETNLSRGVDEYFNDLTDRGVSLGCEDGTASEVVQLRGGIIERFFHVQLPTGTVVTRHDARPEGLWGVGSESGHEYDVITRLQSGDIYADRGIKGTSREVWELRNRVTGALFHLTYAVRYAMDADRNIIVHRERERTACRP